MFYIYHERQKTNQKNGMELRGNKGKDRKKTLTTLPYHQRTRTLGGMNERRG